MRFAGKFLLTPLMVMSGLVGLAVTSFEGENLNAAGVTKVTGDTLLRATASATTVADLVHRWSFNGDLADSIGGQTAKIVGSATSNGKQYTLPGGSYGSSYIDLGSDVLPKTSKAVTIEIWATQISAQNYSRIFSFGGSNGNLYMEWTASTFLNCDEVWFGGKNFSGLQSRLAPYSLGTEYHISVVMTEGNDGVWTAKYYKKNIQTGGTLATYTAQGSDAWSLRNQDLSKCYLGQAVNGSSENTANASYNEVRIWSRALTEDELTASAKAGPDALPGQSSFRIKFDANGGTPAPSDITRDAGAEYGELPTVTRTGYAFDGWYTAVTGGTKVTATTKATGDETLYAYWTESSDGLYMVVDMSNSQAYSVSYLDAVPDGGWTDEYKTNKIVLRRIEPGEFKMGDAIHAGETYDVKLSKPFYIGVFEITQRQWELVMGSRPSFFINDVCYATRPVENISYAMLRGDNKGEMWPLSSDVDEGSFIAEIRRLTEIPFDLPSEAQWEYACRAGTLTDYNNGENMAGDGYNESVLNDVARFGYNAGDVGHIDANCADESGTASVGSYKPNKWGLYDMHGNVEEWCLDRFGDLADNVTDPCGPSTGKTLTLDFSKPGVATRVMRGGSWCSLARDCTSYARHESDYVVMYNLRYCGARLAVVDSRAVVRFDAGGQVEDPVDRILWSGAAYGELPTVTRTGYTFDGWYTAATGGTKVTSTTKATGSVTLYAHWTAVKYAITYNLDGGTNASSNPATYTIEDAVTLAAPTRSGYTFSGWTPNNGKIAKGSTGAKTFTASWTKNVAKYTISFNANGGSSTPAAIIREDGAEYGELPTVTRTGYTFDGWYTAASGGTKVTATTKAIGDVTLYAHWTAVREDTLGGALGAADYAWETSADFPWSVITDAHTQGASAVRSCEMAGLSMSWLRTVVIGPATLSFDYQLQTYGGHFTVECDSDVLLEWKDKYVLNMAWESKSYSIPAGWHVIRFSYTHMGMGFTEGWGNGVRLDNVSFVGGRPPARYSISFNVNGGSSTPAAITRDEGSEYGTLPTVTRTGYTFDGWYTAASGGTKVTSTTKVAGSATLYAHWTSVKYAITYNLNGGTNSSSNPATYTVEDAVTLAAPTRSGYTFSGWTPNNGKIAKGSTGAKTFTASWTKNVAKYTISFNVNGGSSTPAAITRDEGSEYGELPTVTRTGYTFDGWYTVASGGTKVTATTKATDNTTLYAHWTAVKYAITYNLDGGKNASSNPATYTVEDAVTLAAPTRSGYTFSGWTPNDGKIAKGSTGAKTFTAIWTMDEVLEVNNDGDREYSVGEDVGWDCNLFVVEASSAVIVSVTGLPDGLGYRTEVDDNEVLVYFTGRAVRAGRYRVVCIATDEDGRSVSDSIWVEIIESGDAAFDYVDNWDGTITLMRYKGESVPEQLVIPSEYDGKKVTGVGLLQLRTQEEWDKYDGVSFFGEKEDERIVIGSKLKSVKLPEGLVTIGINSPFAYQSGITSVEFPSTLKNIGDWAFCCCTGLKSVDLSGTALENCLWSSYAGCKAMAEVKFPSTLTTLGGLSFAWCRALKSVTFEGNAPTIQNYTSDGGRDGAKWGDWAGRIYVDSGFDFRSFDTQRSNTRYLAGITTYVKSGSSGWGAVPGTWQGSYIDYVDRREEPDPGDDESPIRCNIKPEYRTKADVGVIPVRVVNVGEAVKIAVKGLPSGVKFTAKDVKATVKSAAVPANSIYGAPTKSGVYAATVTVTPTNRKSKMAPIVKGLLFIVRNPGEHVVVANCDAAQGTVKGMGVYASGKKVTLKATAAKEWVFSGWYDGDTLVSRLASYVLTMPEVDVNLTARFVTAAEDAKSIALTVTAGETDIVQTKSITVKQGMYVEWPVAVSALSATTVKVSGLPSGLKFTVKDVMKKGSKTEVDVPANTIYGTPKTASKVDKNGNVTPSKVKITVTTVGKQKQEYIINVTVRGIPAEGTFNGGGANGLVTLTVAKTGKISGKYLADGKTWTLSASGFDTWDDNDRMTATLTAKSGKEVETVELVYEYDCLWSSLFEAMRNEWKVEPQKSLATKLKGQKVQDGEVALTVGANGTVAAKGAFDGLDGNAYSASCSTVLIPLGDNDYAVYLYFPPKVGKFVGLSKVVILHWNGAAFSVKGLPAPLFWVSI